MKRRQLTSTDSAGLLLSIGPKIATGWIVLKLNFLSSGHKKAIEK